MSKITVELVPLSYCQIHLHLFWASLATFVEFCPLEWTIKSFFSPWSICMYGSFLLISLHRLLGRCFHGSGNWIVVLGVMFPCIVGIEQCFGAIYHCLQGGRPQSRFSPLWKPQTSHSKFVWGSKTTRLSAARIHMNFPLVQVFFLNQYLLFSRCLESNYLFSFAYKNKNSENRKWFSEYCTLFAATLCDMPHMCTCSPAFTAWLCSQTATLSAAVWRWSCGTRWRTMLVLFNSPRV
jgi:hypothetical protein